MVAAVVQLRLGKGQKPGLDRGSGESGSAGQLQEPEYYSGQRQPGRVRRPAGRDCAAHPGCLQADFPVCLLIHQHRALFARIAAAVASGRFRDTLLIVVGDHAPPFVRQRYRQAFSDTHVPYLLIDIAPEPNAHAQPADAP